MSVHVKVAGAWQEIGVDAAGGGVPWAKVSGGTVTTVNNPDGSVDEVHTFTANGTLTVESPGYAEVLLVGGGGGGSSGQYGNGGRVLAGIHPLPAGANPVVVGAGGNNVGGPSSIGALATGVADLGISASNVNGAGSTLGSLHTGFTSDISGASVIYAKSGGEIGSIGGGGWNGFGTAGIVIVRVQKSAPTVSGVVATGGTVSEYTGDGSNGVLGQTYKVHTFTASGTLTVTQGGEVDALIVSGGAGVTTSVVGGGGAAISRPLILSAGAIPVVVGAGRMGGNDPNAVQGNPSSIGSLASPAPGPASGAGATVAAPFTGISSYITGSAVTYGRGQQATPVANRGEGSVTNGVSGSTGVVIVRYKV